MRYRVEGEAEAETEAAANPNTKFATSKMRCKLSAAAAAPAAANMMLPLDSSCPFGGRIERIISLSQEKTPLPRGKRKKGKKKSKRTSGCVPRKKKSPKKSCPLFPSTTRTHAQIHTSPKSKEKPRAKKKRLLPPPLQAPSSPTEFQSNHRTLYDLCVQPISSAATKHRTKDKKSHLIAV